LAAALRLRRLAALRLKITAARTALIATISQSQIAVFTGGCGGISSL
jgi:hypothetical protein